MNNIRLFRKEHPYLDFMIVSGENKDKVVVLDGMSESDFGFAKVFLPTEAAVELRMRDLERRNGDFTLFIGQAFLKGDYKHGIFLVDQGSLAHKYLTAEPGRGQYIVLKKSGASIAVLSDAFGLFPYYKFCSQGIKIVATSLHMLAETLRKSSFSVKIDPIAAASMIIVDNALCVQQNIGNSLVLGAELVKPGSVLSVGYDGLTEVPAAVERHGSPISKDDYWDLIKMGAAEIRENVLSAINSSHSVEAMLTGGRDSRVIFAAIEGMGLIRDVPFRTRDIDEGDTAISTGLVDPHFPSKALISLS